MCQSLRVSYPFNLHYNSMKWAPIEAIYLHLEMRKRDAEKLSNLLSAT